MTDVAQLLNDEALEAEIIATAVEVCCRSERAAAYSGCGCGGRAALYLEHLQAESRRRAMQTGGEL